MAGSKQSNNVYRYGKYGNQHAATIGKVVLHCSWPLPATVCDGICQRYIMSDHEEQKPKQEKAEVISIVVRDQQGELLTMAV